SPGGERFVVALAPTPLIDDFYVSRELVIVETETSQVLGRIEHAGKLGQFVWSPDGNRIAFVGAADENDPLEGRIYIAPAEGGTPRRVSQDYPGHVEGIMWRDATTLLYRGARGVFTEIVAFDVDAPFETPPPPEGDPIAGAFHLSPATDRLAV